MNNQGSATERERIARIIAIELIRQDHCGVSDIHDPFAEGVLTWSYIDQGEVDFGKIADAILSDSSRMAASSEEEITSAMIQAAQDRVQGPGEDMYSSIYRAMRDARRNTLDQTTRIISTEPLR